MEHESYESMLERLVVARDFASLGDRIRAIDSILQAMLERLRDEKRN
jgi:hypothetical protein